MTTARLSRSRQPDLADAPLGAVASRDEAASTEAPLVACVRGTSNPPRDQWGHCFCDRCRDYRNARRRKPAVTDDRRRLRELAARFWSKVDASGGPLVCWPWTGAKGRKGYGHMWVDGRMEKAHRLALALSGVPIADDEQAMHRCDNPACCNPTHIRAGTAGDNVRDMVAKDRQPAQMRRRSHCRRGHSMTDNVYMHPNGSRRCRTCRNARLRGETLTPDLAAEGVGLSA